MGDEILTNFRKSGFKSYVDDEGNEVPLALFVRQGVVELHGRWQKSQTRDYEEEGIFREISSTGKDSTMSLWDGCKNGNSIPIGDNTFAGRIKFADGKPTDGEGTLKIKAGSRKLPGTFMGYLRDGNPWSGTLTMSDGAMFKYENGQKSPISSM